MTRNLIIAKIKKIAIKGIPAGCIGVKIDVLIESRIFIYFPIEILYWSYYTWLVTSIQKNVIIYWCIFDTLKQFNRESDLKLSKIKEKKLNSIKSEMEEIKKFIVSNNELDSSEQKQTDYFNNNDEDTITLTEIVNKEEKLNNNNNLGEIKKELIELKEAININKNLLNEILLKIK